MAAPRAVPLVLDQVTVIDVERGARLRDQRVVVVGNRIQALGNWRTVKIPPGARVVPAQGKYLIPGLWDMHVHPSAYQPTLELASHQAYAAYYQLIANGVTGIRDAGASIPLDTFQVWKSEIAAGRRVAPRLIVSGKSVNDAFDRFIDSARGARLVHCSRNPAFGACDRAPPHFVYVAAPEDARQLVDSFKAAGADMIKTYTLSPRTYFAIAAEARRIGIPFGGHLNDGIDGLVASDSGAMIMDHGLQVEHACGGNQDTLVMSLTRCAAVAARLRRNNTWIATWTLGGPKSSDSSTKELRERALRYAGPANVPMAQRGDWRPLTAAERRQLPSGRDFLMAYPDSAIHGKDCQGVLLAYAANLPMMPGEDWPIGSLGSGVHASMLGPVFCGVSPLWALQTATLNPARALRLTDSLGTVAVGKVADLVLLEGDPLEDIWNVSKIDAVMANGRYFDRAALDQLLLAAAAEWRTIAALTPPDTPKRRGVEKKP